MKIVNINQLVTLALSHTNVHGELVISKLPQKQAAVIEKEIHLDLTGVDRLIDTSFVRHTILQHGDARKEASRGQIAITIDDFGKIPQVLREPDEIEYGGKNRQHQDVFLFKKRIGALYIIAEAVRIAKKGNKLVLWTMYKKK